ncbi:MAG: hypothetical protein P8N49_01545 [Opitutales bacterium]|nr:hypothetical protein [Opitutales bacterium]
MPFSVFCLSGEVAHHSLYLKSDGSLWAMARGGLSLVTYIEQMEKGKSYTQDWFYQPEMGWLWTNESTYPFFYRLGDDDGSGQWLYFSQLKDQQGPGFYDYQLELWVYTSSVVD